MFWADATAMPASSAAVLINSLLLIRMFLWFIPRAPSIGFIVNKEVMMRFHPRMRMARCLTSFFSAEPLSAESAFTLRGENERIKRAYFTYLAEAQRFSETAIASARRPRRYDRPSARCYRSDIPNAALNMTDPVHGGKLARYRSNFALMMQEPFSLMVLP